MMMMRRKLSNTRARDGADDGDDDGDDVDGRRKPTERTI